MIVIDRPEYQVKAELHWFGTILHVDVYSRWSRRLNSLMKLDIAVLQNMLPRPLLAFQTASHDPKKRKFIKAVGGVFHHYRTTPLGEKAEIYLFPALD